MRVFKAVKDVTDTQHESSKQELFNMSINRLAPALHMLPMLNLLTCGGTHAICRFEPLHNLSLVISKTIEECVVAMLKERTRKSSAMLTTAGTHRKFNMIRSSLLDAMNGFLRDVRRTSNGYKIYFNMEKGTGGCLSGCLSIENGILGILKGKEFEKVDLVSTFVGPL